MQLRIYHRTAYRYQDAVKYSAQALRLTPRREARQRTLSWSMRAPGRRSEQIDAHGNVMHLLTVEDPHQVVEIIVSGTVEVSEWGEGLLPHEGPLSPLAYLATTPLTIANDALRELSESALAGSAGLSSRDRLHRLAGLVCEKIRYMPGTTSVEDTAASALAHGQGVCQDQAHVFIACCRAAGIPARYVSGYLHTDEGGELASHAWADAWLGESGGEWLGIDVTNNRPVDAHHCRLAVGRDYMDAAPVRGVRRGGGGEELEVSVKISGTVDQ